MTTIPSSQDLLDFIREGAASDRGAVTRKEIADAFSIKGPARADLRRQLKEMEEKGQIALEGRRIRPKGDLPPVVVLDINGTDNEGDLHCVPVTGETGDGVSVTLPAPAAAKVKPPLGVGDRFLGRISKTEDGDYVASPIKRIGRGASRVLGVYHSGRRAGFVEPVNRKAGSSLDIHKEDKGDAKDGDLVWAEPLNRKGYGDRRGRIVSIVGGMDERRNWSLVALAENDIPIEFPDRVIAEAEEQTLPDGAHHEDLRHLPLITIDPKEAKDHDDAVYAEKTDKGWRVIVAIADVSWFVRPHSALDKEAAKRGNSVYLIDRVVPMLPEALSNGLCSLKAGEDRTALCCEMLISENGRKHSHRFFRAMINSRAGLAYEEAQAAADGHKTNRTKDLKETVIDPLWAAWRAMLEARKSRPPLDLDMPERQILLRKDGEVEGVKVKDRLEAHRLIETMMVAANVCAAESLEQKNRELIYRVHDEPDPERVEALRQYLESMDYSLPEGQRITPTVFNRILEKARERDEIELVSLAILRTQMQAIYSTENKGHFGLHLARYAHFTSPIRRYADLTVHRGLVAAFKMGPGGPRTDDEAKLDKTASHISDTERRAVSAERATQDRYLAAYLENETGAVFPGRIAGVTRAGLFVTLDETGADGFVPMRTLRHDYFIHDEEARVLIGKQTGTHYYMGQRVEVRLEEVTPVQGGLRFTMLTDPEPRDGASRRSSGPKSKKKTSSRARPKQDDRRKGASSKGPQRGKPPARKSGGARKPSASSGDGPEAKNPTVDRPSGDPSTEDATIRRRPKKTATKKGPGRKSAKKSTKHSARKGRPKPKG